MNIRGVHLRRFMSLLSLALALNAAAIVVTMWVRSYWVSDEVWRLTTKDAGGHWEIREWSLESSRGAIEFRTHGWDVVDPYQVKTLEASNEQKLLEWRRGHPGLLLARDNIWYQLGFTFRFGRFTEPAPHRPFCWIVDVPHWFLVLLLLALPAWRLLVFRARSGRHRRGLCPACGYDVRASAGRCPECGKPL